MPAAASNLALWQGAVGAKAGHALHSLIPAARPDLPHQTALTQLLQQARPLFDTTPLTTAKACLERFEDGSGLPVVCAAFGPDWQRVTARLPLPF